MRLWHWLEHFKIDPVGFSVEKEDGGNYYPTLISGFMLRAMHLARILNGLLIK